MDIRDKVHITTALLEDLEYKSGIIKLTSFDEFENVLKLEKAILYFLVDWSGPERFSRYTVYTSLNALESNDTPFFMIDCSDQKKKYVENWLGKQLENLTHLYYGGYGETILINKGEVIDFIANPGQFGVEEIRDKIREWKRI